MKIIKTFYVTSDDTGMFEFNTLQIYDDINVLKGVEITSVTDHGQILCDEEKMNYETIYDEEGLLPIGVNAKYYTTQPNTQFKIKIEHE